MALPLSYGANWIDVFWVFAAGPAAYTGRERATVWCGVVWRGARGAGGGAPGVFVTLNVY